jgi:thiol:disulfide interchange protein DsbA
LPTTTTPGVTEVIVFFYYNSPWSAQMAPYLQDWAAEAGPAVHIQWAPAVLDPVWGYGARVFFALDQVGAAAITPKLLQAYDQHLLTYGDSAALVKWLSEQGVQGDDFAHALDDGRVRAHTAWTPTVMTLYGVHSVPTFVINGRYVIEANADTPVPLAVARVRYLVQHLQTPAPTP